MKIFIGILLFIYISPMVTFGQDPEMLIKIKKEISNWNNLPPLNNALISFCLRQTKDHSVLLELNSDKSMIPASNLKLITTAVALESLGENFTFTTTLGYTGKIDRLKVLKGNLYVTGGGDPTLGSPRVHNSMDLPVLLKTWETKIKEAGIEKVEGDLIVDNSLFGMHTTPDGWMWNDIGNYYGASASGINLCENLYKINFAPGRIEGKSTAILSIDPSIEDLKVHNLVQTGKKGSGDNAYIYGAPLSNFRYLNGTIPPGNDTFFVKGSIPDPGYLLGFYLKKYLMDKGIMITGGVKVLFELEEDFRMKLIHKHSSPPLDLIIEQTNLKSINLYAEAIYKTLPLKSYNPYMLTSAQIVKKFFITNKIDTNGFEVTDGCGLSLTNYITSSQLSHVVSTITHKKYFKTFLSSLPLSGKTGTLSRLTKNTLAEGRIRAKTGTQTGIACYTGFVINKENTPYAFSIMVNHYDDSLIKISPYIERLMILLSQL